MTSEKKAKVQLALDLSALVHDRGYVIGMPRGEWDQRLLDAAAQLMQLLGERSPDAIRRGATQDLGPTLANALWAMSQTGAGLITPWPYTWEERCELHRVSLHPGEGYAVLELHYSASLIDPGEWRFYFAEPGDDGPMWRERTFNPGHFFTNRQGDILLCPTKPCDLVHPLHRGVIRYRTYGWPEILITAEPTMDWLAQVEWLLWRREDNPLTALCQARSAYRTAGQQIVSHMTALRDRLIHESRNHALMYRMDLDGRKRHCDSAIQLRVSLNTALSRITEIGGAIDILVNGQPASPLTGLLARGTDPLMAVYSEAIKAHLNALRGEIGECHRQLKKQWDEVSQ